jgi:hypothetical protein
MIFDPLPELSEDSALWVSLFSLVLVRDGEIATVPVESLFGALHAIRAEGARLKPGYPRATIERPERLTPAEWRGIKLRWFGPYKEILEGFLTELMSYKPPPRVPIPAEVDGVASPPPEVEEPPIAEEVCPMCSGTKVMRMHVDTTEKGRRVGLWVNVPCRACVNRLAVGHDP